jgi:ATP-dependent 26S proteasome regulatory subunit
VSASCAAVFSPLVGESERFIRDLFLRARQCAPAVVFLDEIDALVCDRATGLWAIG